MESSTNILDRFEYINLPNFYINRYEIMLVHSFTDEEDDFTSFIKDEFEDDILLQLVLVYINNSTIDINNYIELVSILKCANYLHFLDIFKCF